MKRTLADLQGAFKTPERKTFRPSNYYPFWLMPVDSQAVVRFLPDKNLDNPMGFLVEKIVHNLVINGNKRNVPCLSMYNEECPICALSQQYYKAGDETNGKKYWKKRQHIGQLIVLEDPLPADKETGEKHEGKVRFISLGFQLFEIIKKVFESGDLDEIPFAFEGGYNFSIMKSSQGEYSTYALGSQFARKQSDLTADQIAMVEEESVDLATLLPKHPGTETVDALLNADVSGAEYVDPKKASHGDGDTDATSAFVASVQKTASKKEPVPVEGATDAPFEDSAPVEVPVAAATPAEPIEQPTVAAEETDSDDVLASIRARRRAKSA